MIKRAFLLSLFFMMSLSSLPLAWGDDTIPVTSTGNDDAGQASSSSSTINSTCATTASELSDGAAAAYGSAISQGCTAYSSNYGSCTSAHSAAAMVCIVDLNSNLLSAISVINGLLSAVTAVSVSSSCSTFGQAMDIAKDALSAYSLACGGAQAICNSKCSTGVTNLKTLQANVIKAIAFCATASATSPAGISCAAASANLATLKTAIATELGTTPDTTMAGKLNVCTGKYAALLASGAAGIVSYVASAMEGSSCDSSSSTTDLSVLCTEAAYENTTQCLCYKNPLTTGCPNAVTATSSTFGATAETAATTASTGTTLVTGSDSSGITPGTAGSSSAGGASPSGGGSGVSGGDAGGASGSTGTGTDTVAKINTNTLGGVSGGGSGGSSGGAAAAAEKLKAYLPGGAKDPNAAGSDTSKEVTGAGGKSNWEKVRDRYIDDRSTLLN